MMCNEVFDNCSFPGSVCACYANQLDKVECAASINDICNSFTDANGKNWGFEGCYRDYPDYPDFQIYHKIAYCGVAKCFVDGGTYGSCYCQMFNNLCQEFGDIRKYSVSRLCALDQFQGFYFADTISANFQLRRSVRTHHGRILYS